jgi:stearoyl-CoA desaturase (delta-9 desaturase)
MSRVNRYANLGAVVLPFLAFAITVLFFWDELIGPVELALFALMYVLTGFGITVGYHRMLTHRSFQASKPVEYTFAILGSMAIQGSPIHWVADHRKHHAHSDQEGDPHSPHTYGEGIIGSIKGLFHAHMGWLLTTQGTSDYKKYAKDLLEDRGMRWISKRFLWWIGLSLLIPTVLGFVLSGFTWQGALGGYVWGGLVRIFFLHHVTWSINSVCHFMGRRRFAVEDESRNVFWLALPSLGEAWHHNHHAFPRSASHGLRRWERAMDPSSWLIRGMEKVGLVHHVVEITPERQAQKLAQRPDATVAA